MSERAIQARARQYGGVPRAHFYEAMGARQEPGTVARYVAQDDPATCSRCSDAARGGLDGRGVYLPTECPSPGAQCLGGGHCRCDVIYESDADAYARLTNAQRIAA